MSAEPSAKRAKVDNGAATAAGDHEECPRATSANAVPSLAQQAHAAITEIAIDPADDWHHHLRDGVDVLANLVPVAARQFRRAIAMPNLRPPVTTTALALAYRERILAHVPAGVAFEPLMTLYLTDNTTAEEIRAAKASGKVFAVKLYPNGATTNSDSGVTDWRNARAALEAMQAVGMPLLVHGEVTAGTHPDCDIFDREKVFIAERLRPLVAALPDLKVVMEHITTADAVDFVLSQGPNVAATITAHHLLYNRNALFHQGCRPHKYCLPILKRERHRQALLRAAAQSRDTKKFFLGTDSAPHPRGRKESACGCAGMFTAHAALELYAEAFESAGALDQLEAFASHNGPDFYGLPRNTGPKVVLRKAAWTVPADYALGGGDGKAPTRVVPLRAGESIAWQLVDAE